MRKEKQTFETTLTAEVSKREEELTNLWQEKVDKAISNTGSRRSLARFCILMNLAEARWKVKYAGLEDEYHTLQSRLDEAQRGLQDAAHKLHHCHGTIQRCNCPSRLRASRS